jgi:hypothetical protein
MFREFRYVRGLSRVAHALTLGSAFTSCCNHQTIIDLSPDLIDEVQTGRETATIREGHRDYIVGPAVFDAKRTKIPIEITSLEYKFFHDLTDEDAKLDGGISKDELKASLKTYYPTIKDTDEVTIVHFRVRTKGANQI